MLLTLTVHFSKHPLFHQCFNLEAHILTLIISCLCDTSSEQAFAFVQLQDYCDHFCCISTDFQVTVFFSLGIWLLGRLPRVLMKEEGNSRLYLLFIFGRVGSLLLCAVFLQLWRAGATLRCGARASHRGGFSRCGAQALERRLSSCQAQQLWHASSVVVVRGLQSAGSVVVAHGLSCSAACGTFPDQGSNPCPLHWQADS